MNDANRWLNNLHLADADKFSLQKSLITGLQQIWQQCVNWWSHSRDFQVRQRIDRFGNPYWRAYNPITGESISSGSETEVLNWIEQQLYR